MRCSKKSSYSAAEIIEGNNDLLIQILIFFPITSLLRFKVVNKRWQSLISDPFFRRRHTEAILRRESEAAFILGSEESIYTVWNPTSRRLTSLSPPLPQKYPLVKILHSCNGLLLLRCRKTKRLTHYYIFNPTTMQLRQLDVRARSFNALYLIFDPSLSPYYRVVLFKNSAANNVHVYNSESHEWKSEDVHSVRSGVRKGRHLNGGIYFYKFRSSSTRFVPQAEGNVAESIRNPPRHQSGGRQKNYVMESNGFVLCLTLSFKNNGSNILHVSEMKGIESGWTNKYKIDIKHILGKRENCVDGMDLLGVIRGEKEQDSLVLFRLKWRKNLMFYRFCDGVFEDIVDFNSQEFQNENPFWCVSDVHHFIPSFAPV